MAAARFVTTWSRCGRLRAHNLTCRSRCYPQSCNWWRKQCFASHVELNWGLPAKRGLSTASFDFSQRVYDADIDNLVADGRPVILHCGARWSPKSKLVEARLNEWAGGNNSETQILYASFDLQDAPRIVRERQIRSMPTVLLLRDGKLEARADGADVSDLDRILKIATVYGQATSETALLPEAALKRADELRRRGNAPHEIASLCQQALDFGPSPHAFRARVKQLQCALQSAEVSEGEAIDPHHAAEVSRILHELHEIHQSELCGTVENAHEIDRLIAHAGLMVDAWAGPAAAPNPAEHAVLRLYADGKHHEALEAALKAYKREALGDLKSLILAYCQPERPVPDAPREANPVSSVWRCAQMENEIRSSPGPTDERALIRRLFRALGPDNEITMKAITELEFLLDREKWIPFHTRRIFLRKGGKPKMGRGTGKRSGYSKGYWTAWDPGRLRKNTRPMGSPWSDKGD